MVLGRLEGSTNARTTAAETRTLISRSFKAVFRAKIAALDNLSIRLIEKAAQRRTILSVSLRASISVGTAVCPISAKASAALLRIILFSLLKALLRAGTAELATGPICPSDFTALTLTSQLTSLIAVIKKGTADLADLPIPPRAKVALALTVQSLSSSV